MCEDAMAMTNYTFCQTLCILLAVWRSYSLGDKDKVVYKFAEYPYKDSTKNEMAYREFESACEQSCLSHVGPARFACVRECVSPSCYRQLYANDPLEEGEIDVRLNSFKGCFTQRLGRPRQ